MHPAPKYTALGLTAVGLAVLGALFILFPAVRMLGVALLITAIIIGIVVLTQRDRIIWEGVTAICLPAVILVAAAGIGIASTPSTSTPSAHRTVSDNSPPETTDTATLYSAAKECGLADKDSLHKPSLRHSRVPGYDSVYADFTYSSDPNYDQNSDPMEYGLTSQARCLLSHLGVSEESISKVINTDETESTTNQYLIRSTQSHFDDSLFTLDFYELN